MTFPLFSVKSGTEVAPLLPCPGMPSSLLEVKNLSLRYGPQEAWVLRHIDLTVSPGMILGILGQNGVGKTSLLRCVMGLLAPTKGSVRAFGCTWGASSRPHLQKIGVQLESPGLYRLLKAEEYLHYFAKLYGVVDIRGRIDALMRIFQFEERHRACGLLSQGNRQKLHLMRTLLAKPELLVWDEPTDHLDPASQEATLQVLRDYVVQGQAAALVASHRIEHLERICTHLLILSQGRVTLTGSMSEWLQNPIGMRIAWQDGPESPLAVHAELRSWSGRHALQALHTGTGAVSDSLPDARVDSKAANLRLAPGMSGGLWLGPEDLNRGPDLVKSLSSQGYRIMEVTVVRPTLADLYREATAEGVNALPRPQQHSPASELSGDPPIAANDPCAHPRYPLSFWRTVQTVARHEMLHMRREPRFLLPFVWVPLVLILVQGFLFAASQTTQADALSPTLALLGVLSSALCIPLGADAIAGERERKSLELLRCTPVAPSALFTGKALALLPLPWLLGWTAQAVMMLVFWLQGGSLASYLGEAVAALGISPLLALTTASLALFVSARSPTARHATQTLAPVLLILFLAVPIGFPRLMALSGWAAFSGMAALAAGLLALSAMWLTLARKRLLEPI
jgi:ABC-type multidrug transport system ATPase subunit/ABC-type transport system involved in multi-copper enzyme maturation permease subunit